MFSNMTFLLFLEVLTSLQFSSQLFSLCKNSFMSVFDGFKHNLPAVRLLSHGQVLDEFQNGFKTTEYVLQIHVTVI